MEDENRSGGGESSRPSSSFVKSGDRQVFAVDLRPGETTIVSWKKLVRDANKVNNGSSAFEAPVSAPEPPTNANPRLESRISPATGAPVQQSGDEAKDEPGTNRFNAVIEKIERLYMVKDSSDDEDMNDNPDDDQYDTEDSFIDDAELDEYFEVDNSTVKHDGFFVNRGTLEHTEMTIVPDQQPKKRRRKDLSKGGENDEGRLPAKHTKLAKTVAAKITSVYPKILSSATQHVAVSGVHNEDPKSQNQLNVSVSGSKKKSSDASKSNVDPSERKLSNGDTSVPLAQANDFVDKQKSGVLSEDPISKLRDEAVSSDTLHQKYRDKNAHAQSRSQSSRSMGGGDDFESSIKSKEKNGKSSHVHKKDGSTIRPKSSLLERSIRELEKMVAESRPPSGEEVDNSSQAIKRRLPRDIKMKLGKIARLAQASHGKFSKELLTRLMSILGHIIQLRTLKRNLKLMLSMSSSDNDNRFQLIKKEVIDLIKIQTPSVELKALEQQARASDDFQGTGTEGKIAPKRKFTMEPAMEDKICDLYDLYADGLEDDTAPQMRKLYTELAQLWPNGFMDAHGIKRAICRAKERRRALHNINKEQEKLKRKKILAEEGVRTEGNSILPTRQHGRDRLAIYGGQNQVSGTARMPSPLLAPNHEKPRNKKLMVSSSNSPDESRVGGGDSALPKKKAKRDPELDSEEARNRPEKLPSKHGEERSSKPPIKQSTSSQKPSHNHQSATLLPSLEQSS